VGHGGSPLAVAQVPDGGEGGVIRNYPYH
jgi:hypothetical protein